MCGRFSQTEGRAVGYKNMKKNIFCIVLGAISILLGIYQVVVNCLACEQINNKFVSLFSSLSIPSMTFAYFIAGILLLKLGFRFYPWFAEKNYQSYKYTNEIKGKKSMTFDELMLKRTLLAHPVLFIIAFVSHPKMFQDGTWLLFILAIIFIWCVAGLIYVYQSLDQNIVKPILRMLISAVILSFGIYVAGISHKSLDTPSEMWDHDTESKLFTISLIVSLIALVFGIQALWQLIKNKKAA